MLAKVIGNKTTYILSQMKSSSEYPVTGTISLNWTGKLKSYTGSDVWLKITITHNWISKTYESTYDGEFYVYSNSIKLYNWDSFSINHNWATFNSRRITLVFDYTELDIKFDKIYELKNIWEKITGYLFWKLPDGTRRDGN